MSRPLWETSKPTRVRRSFAHHLLTGEPEEVQVVAKEVASMAEASLAADGYLVADAAGFIVDGNDVDDMLARCEHNSAVATREAIDRTRVRRCFVARVDAVSKQRVAAANRQMRSASPVADAFAAALKAKK